MLGGLLTAEVLGYTLVFARLGSAMIFLPAFGETGVPMRHRLFLALLVSLALYPATGVGPVDLEQPLALLVLLGIEITIGLWIGLTARILMSALQFAGYQVGLVSGLANAFAPSMGAFEGATLIATAMMLAATALIFATDLHHVIIRALLMSYEVFPPGGLMPGDMARQTVAAASASFYIGLSLAAPFYLMGLVLNVGMGLANRMMPTLPVFFVAQPVLIAAGFAVLLLAAPSMLTGFLDRFADWLGRLVL
ncbi:flagellar biosynthetic protein FliR [Mesobaculum littorinae]|uniref:Flagellar biosynthetic protein FliR n=1 Tax=Mesobaculum littorinae TaxID=2486419 RepID=A0A438ADZ3_9RHOB|nr:flagellar biosynthetic protein FliR [Mesobaculum littorinae]RVV96885.1 flagellar biosynthetic protein FliR [Mesobaculum littorinae]